MSGISAPVFAFGGSTALSNSDAYTRAPAPRGELPLTGPSAQAPAGTLPVRGDLAHIRLAGVHFVPHYAVPMPHRVIRAEGASLRAASRAEADCLCTLATGSEFAVLDIAGNWAWGQAGEDGLVGYVATSDLQAIEP